MLQRGYEMQQKGIAYPHPAPQDTFPGQPGPGGTSLQPPAAFSIFATSLSYRSKRWDTRKGTVGMGNPRQIVEHPRNLPVSVTRNELPTNEIITTLEQSSKKQPFCPPQLKPAAVWFCSRFNGRGLERWERKTRVVASGVLKEVPPKRSSQEKPYQRTAALPERAQQLCNQLWDLESHGRAFPAKKGQLCSQKCNTGSRGGSDTLPPANTRAESCLCTTKQRCG